MFERIPKQYRAEASYLPTQRLEYIIDVGAYIGYTALAFRRWYPEARIVAFEPLYFEELLKNTEGQEIECRAEALGAREEIREFSFGDQRKAVPVRRLEEIVSGVPDFIKIDVEGFEAAVLEGAYHLLEKHRPIVQLEVLHGKSVFRAFFESLGYREAWYLWPDAIYLPGDNMTKTKSIKVESSVPMASVTFTNLSTELASEVTWVLPPGLARFRCPSCSNMLGDPGSCNVCKEFK